MSRLRGAIHFRPGLLIRLHPSGRQLKRNPLEGRPAKERRRSADVWTWGWDVCGGGRDSVPPERLLKAWLLMEFYTVRTERLFSSSGLQPGFPFRPQHVLEKSGAVNAARRRIAASPRGDEFGKLQRGRRAHRRLGPSSISAAFASTSLESPPAATLANRILKQSLSSSGHRHSFQFFQPSQFLCWVCQTPVLL